MNAWGTLIILISCGLTLLHADEPRMAKFRAVEIDSKIEIGYGVTVADVDGDKKPDIVLADKKQFVWYRNPGWEKSVLAENLTALDNVCVAARDIDGDGKAEIAVGAGWNPGDTVGSGAVFYLIAPKNRAEKWEAVQLPHEPTVHRMRWMRSEGGQFELFVAPLHGRGNKDGAGAGVKLLSYKMPPNPRAAWKTELVNDSLHMTHNFEVVKPMRQRADELLVAGKEGVFRLVKGEGGWKASELAGKQAGAANGAGEVRVGKFSADRSFIATIEPMHGNQLVLYTMPVAKEPGAQWKRQVIDDSLKEGHALACADLLGLGFDQVVVGWRGKNNEGKTGIKMFSPVDPQGNIWQASVVDDSAMACEDLCLADLNGDGKLDIIASGRATKNVKIYFNEH